MRIRTTLTLSELQAIAQACDVKLVERQSCSVSEPTTVQRGVDRGKFSYDAISLRPLDMKDEYGDRPWQRVSASMFSTERRVFAVCWHGHATFMRTLFSYDPQARITSTVGDWKGQDDFLERFEASAWTNVGSQMYPNSMAEVCNCQYRGTSYSDERTMDHANVS